MCVRAALSEDGFRHCALRELRWRRAQCLPGRAREPPQPGVGRPAGILLQEPPVATAEKTSGTPTSAQAPATVRQQAFYPERRNEGAGAGGPRSHLAGSGCPAFALAAAKAHRCRGRGLARPPRAVIDGASHWAPRFVYSRVA